MTRGAEAGRPAAHIAVIGAGPAGLMAAEIAAAGGAAVTVFDHMPSPGRKFLYAGRGGLNLTHAEPAAMFATRYGPAAERLRPALDRFDAAAMRRWCDDLGVATFVGSSGRVFPVGMKTSPLLRAWLRRLTASGVGFRVRHRWIGWSDTGALRLETPDGERVVQADAVVLALGGASWPGLGSDGRWPDALAGSADFAPFAPANCGCVVGWSDRFRERNEGSPLKNVAVCFAGRIARGDLVVTRSGLEGGPLYSLVPHLREALERDGSATLAIALRPDVPTDTLVERLRTGSPKQSRSSLLRKRLHLSPVAIALLREALGPAAPAFADPASLAATINAIPLRISGIAPIDRAISSAGGIRLSCVDADFMWRGRPGVFLAGEMLDWEAPTGGYLLQACFATGAAAGRGALAWLRRSDETQG